MIKCRICGNEEIGFVSNFELFNPETEEYQKYDGYLCKNCNCFHDEDFTFFQFDATPNFNNKCFK